MHGRLGNPDHRGGRIHWDGRGGRRISAGEAVDEVIRRPGPGNLHLAVAHGSAGARELVLVPLHALAIDKVGHVQHHLPAFSEPAADFLVERSEEPVHLEAHCTCPCLALPLPHGVFTKTGEVLAAYSLGGKMLADFLRATVVDEDLQMHLGFAAELIDVGEELTLIGADGFAEGFVIVKNRAEAERKDG